MSVYLLLILVGLPLAGFMLARRRAVVMVGRGTVLHSLPDFHGAYVAAWTGIPSIILLVPCVAVQGTLLDTEGFASLPDGHRARLGDRGLAIPQARSLAQAPVLRVPSARTV